MLQLRTTLGFRDTSILRDEFVEPVASSIAVIDIIEQANRLHRSVAKHNVRMVRKYTLHEPHHLRINAELDYVLWLCGSCQLCVGDFVGVSTEV